MKTKTGIYILSSLLFLTFCDIALAKDPDLQLNNRLLGAIFKLEKMKDDAAADIQKCEANIQQSENTMRKSEDILRKAQQKGNAQAETIARQASAKAQEAITKNKELKRLAELKKKRAEETLAYLRSGDKNLEARIEQAEFEINRPEWTKNERELIEQRLAQRNPYIDPIYASLTTKVPPPLPPRKYDMLQPGDVLLISPEDKSDRLWDKIKESARDSAFWINAGDKISSVSSSPASHTVLYLKEVNGKKLFLDHTPEGGSHVISEAEFLKTYGHRDALVAQPVKAVETAKIWEAAKELVKRESQIKAGKASNVIDKSGYGLYGNDNMVCSEASRWALVNSGLKIPESASPLKRLLGIHYGPANFFSDEHNFIITPLYAPSK